MILLRYKRNFVITEVIYLNRRMPRCNSVLQTEKDPFPREIRPNFPENCHFSTFFRTPKSSKTFGHFPVNNTGVIVIVFMWEKEFIVRSSPVRQTLSKIQHNS